jgi:putative FmdB family regulatory protein
MPTYDYECRKCGQVFEAFHSLKSPAPPCPACGAKKPRRLMSAVAFRTQGDPTAGRVEAEIKKRLGQGRATDALNLAEKADKLAGNRPGMGKIKAARDKLRGKLGKD